MAGRIAKILSDAICGRIWPGWDMGIEDVKTRKLK